MVDYQGQEVIFPVMMRRGAMFISNITLYLMAYDVVSVLDNDNFTSVLVAKIQVGAFQVDIIGKLSIEPRALAKQWEITPDKGQKTNQVTILE